MRKLFGTDGVRGVANVYPMTSEVALKLGRAVARYSGTEMLLRIMVEGIDRDTVRAYANEIGQVARKRLSEGKHA